MSQDEQNKATCGCNRNHLIEKNSSKTLLHNNTWWDVGCFFQYKEQRLPALLGIIKRQERQLKKYRKSHHKFVDMKNFVKNCRCEYCGFPSGNRFKLIGMSVFCGKCKKNQKESA